MKKTTSAKKKKPVRKSLWEKSLRSFTMVGPVDNSNIREIKSEEGLSPKLIISLQKAKVKSTEKIYHKTNTIIHKIFSVYSTSRSKVPSLYIVMGSVIGINYTYVNLIGVSPEGKRLKTKLMIGD